MKSYIIEESKKMSFHTDLKVIFEAIGNIHSEYDWLITDLEIHGQAGSLIGGENFLISGEELKKTVEQNDFQVIWGVFTALEKDSIKDIDISDLKPFPYADGNSEIWIKKPSIQLDSGLIELVCWDSTSTILSAKEEAVLIRFKNFFGEEAVEKSN